MYNKEQFFSILTLHGITNKELSGAIGVSTGNISDWNSGRSKPNIDAITKIADYLGCSVDYLLGRTDNPEINKPLPEESDYRIAAWGAKQTRGNDQPPTDENIL